MILDLGGVRRFGHSLGRIWLRLSLVCHLAWGRRRLSAILPGAWNSNGNLARALFVLCAVALLRPTQGHAFRVWSVDNQHPTSTMLWHAQELGSQACRRGSLPKEVPSTSTEACARGVLNVTYWVDTTHLPTELEGRAEDVRAAVALAFTAWSGIKWRDGRDLRAPITFHEASQAPDPLLDPDDGVTVVTWDRSGLVHKIGYGFTFQCCDPESGALSSGGDIYLDAGSGPWIVDKKYKAPSGTYAPYVPSVVAHEMGHALGLAHSNLLFGIAMMFQGIGEKQQKRKVDLASDDANGIRHLYGANEMPRLGSLDVVPTAVPVGGQVSLTLGAMDPEGDELRFKRWKDGGSFEECTNRDPICTWVAPRKTGTYTITVGVRDVAHKFYLRKQQSVLVGSPPAAFGIALDIQPNTGTPPLTVDLTVHLVGIEGGKTDLWLFCDRSDDGTDLGTEALEYPDMKGAEIKIKAACTYFTLGQKTTKVIARRNGSAAVEARATITLTGCGDNLLRDGEQCDGSDDAACPWLCQENCTCVPTPTSPPTITATVTATPTSTRAGTTERVSVSSSGVQGNAASGDAAISADGRYVAFYSQASNLIPGDANGFDDVFVHDRLTGTTELVSVSSAGTLGDASSSGTRLRISADGSFVAFLSGAANLVTGDTNSRYDVFVRDRITGTTERVSVASDEAQGNNDSLPGSMSADGRYVAFESDASNLVPGDTNVRTDVFVRDRQLGVTERVSVASDGTQGSSDSRAGSISADGRYVAFHSRANLTLGTSAVVKVFLRDRIAGTTELVSISSAGTEAGWDSDSPSISADGRYVAFRSYASNLVSGDTNTKYDIFLRDRELGATERVSVASDGTQGNGDASGHSTISPNGRFVAFSSGATNLVPGDTNASFFGSLGYDIFVRDRQLGLTERVSVSNDGTQGNNDSFGGSVSANGRYVAFDSDASNLVSGDTNGFSVRDVFVRDRGE